MSDHDTPESVYRRPFAVYVVWHPSSRSSGRMADALFRILGQDPNRPFQPGLRIPVRFRSEPGPDGGELPAPIPLLPDDTNAAQRTAIVVLVDDDMLQDRDAWGEYVAGLWHACANPTAPQMLLPVGVSDQAYKLHEHVAASQFIRLPRARRLRALSNQVLHDLCRLMLDRQGEIGGVQAAAGLEPVKIFLSHSKHDHGVRIAEEIRDHIAADTQLKSFFDAVDIPTGSDWSKVLLQEAAGRALLVIKTDSYASRPWCQREVLTGKESRMPILVLDAVEKREPRSFPYLGNNPTLRWDPDDPQRIPKTIGALLYTVLGNAYFKARVEGLSRLYGLAEEPIILGSPPELLIAAQLFKQGLWSVQGLVIYPDPPLGTDELERLRALQPGVELITPTMLPNYIQSAPQ